MFGWRGSRWSVITETGLHEARWYEHEAGEDVVCCLLCPQGCRLGPKRTGLCRVRERRGDKLYTLNYGRLSSLGLDPIEKKPLYHFFPGALVLSAGTIGCNLACGFCQNWQISQGDAPTRRLGPVELADLAAGKAAQGNIGLAYTYSEPCVWYEYVMDVAPLVRERGLKNVMVTNGYLNRAPLAELLPHLDAVNLDIKAMKDEFYRRACRGRLAPVLDFAEAVKEARVHLELTNLIVPGWNDAREDLRALVDWVADLDRDIPLHFSRYFPQYRFTAPPTPPETLIVAYETAREKLPYVYLGNIEAAEGRDTICQGCGAVLVAREGFGARPIALAGDKCRDCGRPAPFRL